jgi:peptidoglycan glycosyltransferase
VNARIARLGTGLLALYLLLFGWLNWVQVGWADRLNEDPNNSRALVRDFDRPRGQILTADGTVIALSLPTQPGDRFENQRAYPTGELFAHVTGFFNFSFGSDGAEREFNDDLAGATTEIQYQSISDLFVDRQRVGDVTLTLRDDVQEVARQALGEQRGSVVALDPRTGAILALWSFPSYDPNALSTHDQAAADAARDALDPASQQSALIPAAYRRSFPPGSTFKVVTGSIGVNDFGVTETQPSYPVETEFDVDFTDDELSNFSGERCGGPFPEILRVSCNSAFAHMGVETIGESGMILGAERFGFNASPPLDLPAPAASTFPTDFPDDQGNGPLARASIGQGDTRATPLQMAMVAGAIANGGVLMTPHVLDRVTDDRGEVVRQFEPVPMGQAITPATAALVQQAMIGVVQRGTGTAARIPGATVGGKTGTAQVGSNPPSSHAWFIAFAGPEGQAASVAVAVLVEAQPGVSEVTGGRVAAPIARQVIETVLNG